jgi:Niemann-Pick C2 protein
MYAVVLVMISLMVSSAESTAYKDCPSTEGAIGHATSFELSPCTSEPCNFKHGETVNVKITFTAGNDSNTLKSTVYGYVVGIPVSFPLPNSNGCSNSGITCPIKKGQTYTYNSSFQVLNTYPQITLVVMWKLDGATSNEVCFTFPMSINDNPAQIVG